MTNTPLCANMGETTASSFISVEGGEVGDHGSSWKFEEG
jgi:hypothetical protein